LRARLSRWDRYRLLLLAANPQRRLTYRFSGEWRSSLAWHGHPLRADARFQDDMEQHLRLLPPACSFQRYVADEFWSYFERVGDIGHVFRSGTVVRARRMQPTGDAASAVQTTRQQLR
jgi:hypothetical protein